MTLRPSALGLTPEQTEGLLRTAGLAPSLHNSQPWQFRPSPTVLELHADLDRQLPVADPEGRELRLACGAALFNLRLGLHGLGIRPIVTLFPDPAQPALLAAVRHGGRKPPTPPQQRLLDAVPRRRTNRRPFLDTPVTSAERHALGQAALAEGAWLHLMDDPGQRAALQRAAARAHRAQLADPAFVAELNRWLNPDAQRRDGVPVLPDDPRPAPQDRWTVRDFTGGTGPDRPLGANFEHDPTIGVLTPHLAGPESDLRAGQALQRVLLTATEHGLAASFLSQVVELPAEREELRRLIGATRSPVAVLRVGRGWPVPATPRREVADLIMPAAAPTG